MRLGGPVMTPEDRNDPERWTAALQRLGYSTAAFPVDSSRDQEAIRAYVQAAEKASILIAEVGAWQINIISPDEQVRHASIDKCQAQLALADQVGAVCCVSIAGSRAELWDGPHPDNLSDDTFALIVDTVRAIIDAVKPTRAFYTLETMPWIYPDSADSYLQLLRAIDRRQFAVHLDPVNMISSPERFFRNGSFLRDCFSKLGPYIKCCHVKDIRLGDKLTVHLDEVRPGAGKLDYRILLQELNKLDPDTPVLLEHLPSAEEYRQAGDYVRSVAEEIGVAIK